MSCISVHHGPFYRLQLSPAGAPGVWLSLSSCRTYEHGPSRISFCVSSSSCCRLTTAICGRMKTERVNELRRCLIAVHTPVFFAQFCFCFSSHIDISSIAPTASLPHSRPCIVVENSCCCSCRGVPDQIRLLHVKFAQPGILVAREEGHIVRRGVCISRGTLEYSVWSGHHSP